MTLKNHPARVFVVLDAIDECSDAAGLEEAISQKWVHAPNWLVLVCSRCVDRLLLRRRLPLPGMPAAAH
jgi:hypothetical protein